MACSTPSTNISRTPSASREPDHLVFKPLILGLFPQHPYLAGLSKTPLISFTLTYHNRAYPLASLGHANYILRHYGYKSVFIWGLCLYGIGALIAWPCILHRSFGGFCAAIFIIGNGLGSLETAANPYITGMSCVSCLPKWRRRKRGI